MKALTICQPYAHLICLPDDHDRAKRVENRKWPTDYRGKLLIHSGKSRKFLELSEDGKRDESYDIPLSDMMFGAIVAVCNLADCFPKTNPISYECAIRRRPWLKGHEHVEGPWCFVLTEVRVLPVPIPCNGLMGLWNPSEDILAKLSL